MRAKGYIIFREWNKWVNFVVNEGYLGDVDVQECALVRHPETHEIMGKWFFDTGRGWAHIAQRRAA